MAILYQRPVYFDPVGTPANCKKAVITVVFGSDARNVPGNQVAKTVHRGIAAVPALPRCRDAFLSSLGSVDTVRSDRRFTDADRIAVYNLGYSLDISR